MSAKDPIKALFARIAAEEKAWAKRIAWEEKWRKSQKDKMLDLEEAAEYKPGDIAGKSSPIMPVKQAYKHR